MSTKYSSSTSSASTPLDCSKVQICLNFAKGSCGKGEQCKFSHDIKQVSEHYGKNKREGLCFDFIRGACRRPWCIFSHDISNFEIVTSDNRGRTSVCFDFFSKGSCKRGDKCKYSHVMTDVVAQRKNTVCRDYLKGKCLRGPSCKYTHDVRRIIAPEHLQNGASVGFDFSNDSTVPVGVVSHSEGQFEINQRHNPVASTANIDVYYQQLLINELVIKIQQQTEANIVRLQCEQDIAIIVEAITAARLV